MYNKGAVFVVACAGMLLFGISLITLGSLAQPLQSRFGLDGVGSGIIFSLLPVGILGGSLLFGPVCDRYGYKLLLITGGMGMFLGFQALAHCSSLSLLKAGVFIFGLGGGIINGATNALVADISINKGPDLSLLGVFFGLGAIGMPLIMGMLSGRYGPFMVTAVIGWLCLIVAAWFAFTRFPPAKHQKGAGFSVSGNLLRPILILISFFLFFQSSLEAIVNNWTTNYLAYRKIIPSSASLYALSIHMMGMILLRLLSGTVFRRISQIKLMWISLLLLAAGILLMQVGTSVFAVTAGLFLSGAGLAPGFPVMLGLIGERFESLSGTAFSVAFSIALTGNMLINYLAGIIVHKYGIRHLTTVCYAEIVVMAILFFFIIQQNQSKQSTS